MSKRKPFFRPLPPLVDLERKGAFVSVDPGGEYFAACRFTYFAGCWECDKMSWVSSPDLLAWPDWWTAGEYFVVSEDQMDTDQDKMRRVDAKALARTTGAVLSRSNGPGLLISPNRYKSGIAKKVSHAAFVKQLTAVERELFENVRPLSGRRDASHAFGLGLYVCRRFAL